MIYLIKQISDVDIDQEVNLNENTSETHNYHGNG